MERRYVQSLNESLIQLMNEDENVLIIGEDVSDPYGGAFKVTKGLSTKFPTRVLTTPISESGITGFATGLSLRGFRPIVEIMFGDFVTLIADQLINHACKFKWIYNQKVNVPLIIRTPMGGRRGYGPTHSQTLEQMFLSVPQLKIIAPSHLHDPGSLLYKASIMENNPVMFIENKLLYSQKIREGNTFKDFFIKEENEGGYSTICASLVNFSEPTDAVIICYGGMVPSVLGAARTLIIEEEIIVHVIIPSIINPIPIDDILKLINNNSKVIIAEEGNIVGGWSGELSSQLYFRLFKKLSVPIQRIGSKPFPIPSSKYQEDQILPQEQELVDAVKLSLSS